MATNKYTDTAGPDLRLYRDARAGTLRYREDFLDNSLAQTPGTETARGM